MLHLRRVWPSCTHGQSQPDVVLPAKWRDVSTHSSLPPPPEYGALCILSHPITATMLLFSLMLVVRLSVQWVLRLPNKICDFWPTVVKVICMAGCSTGGSLLIRRSLVWIPPSCLSKCPKARYWTPNCCVCVWMVEFDRSCKQLWVIKRLEKCYRSPFTICYMVIIMAICLIKGYLKIKLIKKKNQIPNLNQNSGTSTAALWELMSQSESKTHYKTITETV